MYRRPRYLKIVTAKNPKKLVKVAQTPLRPLTVRARGVKPGALKPFEPIVVHRRGYFQPKTEIDPLEKYATPRSKVKGYQTERIFYKKCLDSKLVPGADFTFQTSESGGRLELGGIVADFVFPSRQLVVQVQGPTHTQPYRMVLDQQQRSALAEKGLSVEYVDLKTLYDPQLLSEWFRKHIMLVPSSGGARFEGMGQMHDDTLFDMAIRIAMHIDDALAGIMSRA